MHQKCPKSQILKRHFKILKPLENGGQNAEKYTQIGTKNAENPTICASDLLKYLNLLKRGEKPKNYKIYNIMTFKNLVSSTYLYQNHVRISTYIFVILGKSTSIIKGPLLVTVRLEGYFMGRFPVHGGNRNA